MESEEIQESQAMQQLSWLWKAREPNPETLKEFWPQGPKKCPLRLFNDCASYGLSMRACNWNITDFEKKLFSTWLFEGKSLIWSSDFVRGQSVAETCFSYTGAEGTSPRTKVETCLVP